MDTPVFENLRLELRRGSLVLAVLAALRTEQYGYTLRKALSEQGLEVDEGTLYPLLRRLETQGLLESEWREEEKRTKRFYRLSEEGADVLAQLFDEWRQIDAALNAVLSEHDDGIGRTISAGRQVLSHRKGSGRHPARVGGKPRV
jgi:PadR family transcriptional regulator PadR